MKRISPKEQLTFGRFYGNIKESSILPWDTSMNLLGLNLKWFWQFYNNETAWQMLKLDKLHSDWMVYEKIKKSVPSVKSYELDYSYSSDTIIITPAQIYTSDVIIC